MFPRKGGSEGNCPSPSKVSAHMRSHRHSYPLPSFVTCHQHTHNPLSSPLSSHPSNQTHSLLHTPASCQSTGVGVLGILEIRLLECLSYKPFCSCQHLRRVSSALLLVLLQMLFPGLSSFSLHLNDLLGIESSWWGCGLLVAGPHVDSPPPRPQCVTAQAGQAFHCC